MSEKEKIKDLMRMHFARLSGRLESIDVPELSPRNGPEGTILDEEMVRVYFRPVETLSDMTELLTLNATGRRADLVATKFALRVLDSSGNQIYSKLERADIMRTIDARIIGRIVSEIEAFDANEEHAQAVGKQPPSVTSTS